MANRGGKFTETWTPFIYTPSDPREGHANERKIHPLVTMPPLEADFLGSRSKATASKLRHFVVGKFGHHSVSAVDRPSHQGPDCG